MRRGSILSLHKSVIDLFVSHPPQQRFREPERFPLANNESNKDTYLEPATGRQEGTQEGRDPVAKGPRPNLPIFSILDSIDFSDHFVLLGDVGTGKSTVTPIHEFESS